MEADLAGLLDQALHTVYQSLGRIRLIPFDVIQRTVAEGAFPPVATVCQGQFVPAAVAPKLVHRVGHFHDRDVFVQWQALEGAYQFLFGDRPVQIAQRLVKRVLSIIQQEVIDVFEEAGIRDGAKFRIHETASHKDRDIGMCLP